MAPKLSFSSLPRKPIDHHPGLSTPPIQALASIPFEWEEVPGKPKEPSGFTAKAAADLPPGLLNETNMGAPVIDAPFSRSFSGYQNHKEMVLFGSGRFRSFRRRKINNPSLEPEIISASVFYDCNDGGVGRIEATKVKRRSRFWGFSNSRSHLWENVYESLKQVISWRHTKKPQKIELTRRNLT